MPAVQMNKIKIPKVPKGFRFIFAILALLIIIGFVLIMGIMIYQKTSNLMGFSQTPVTNCTDTDGGKIPEVFGACIDATRQAHSDVCVLTGLREPLKLQEYFCQNNACISETISCQFGFVCSSGQCVVA